MITTAIALLITIQTPQQDSSDGAKPTASQILSRVFNRYAKAQSLRGQIKLTQTAQNVSLNIVTDLQYDRPSKLYLHQAKNGSKPHEWLVSSDGNYFSYENPHPEFGAARNIEAVTQHGVFQSVGDIYLAGWHSIGDRNAILETAISSPSRLNRLRSQWVSLSYEGRVMWDGQLVHKITGQYRESEGLRPSGQFEIDVTENDDFARYVTWEKFMVRDRPDSAVEVKSEWISTLKVDAKTDPTLYRVVQ